jgi:hypothetical protein
MRWAEPECSRKREQGESNCASVSPVLHMLNQPPFPHGALACVNESPNTPPVSFLEILAFVGTALKAGAAATGWSLLGGVVGLFLAVGLIVLGWFGIRKRDWQLLGSFERWVRIGVMVIWILTIPGMMIGGASLIGFGHGVKTGVNKLGLVEQACEKVIGYPVAYLLVQLAADEEVEQPSEEELAKRVDALIHGRELIRIEDMVENWSAMGRSALTNALSEVSEGVRPKADGLTEAFAAVIEVKFRRWLAGGGLAGVETVISEIATDLAERDKAENADAMASVSEFTATVSRLYVEPRVDREFGKALKFGMFMLIVPPLLFILLPPAAVEGGIWWLRRRDFATSSEPPNQ